MNTEECSEINNENRFICLREQFGILRLGERRDGQV
jgi:hypothetical protein